MDFNIDLNDKEKARLELKRIQDEIESLLDVIATQKKEILRQVDVIDSAQNHIKSLEKSTVGLTEAMKSVHSILGSKSDLFKGDEEMKVIMESLGTFIMGSSSIKLGVLNNEN